MIPFADLLLAAQIAEIAVPAAVRFARAIGCVILDCPAEHDGLVLAPADLPDAAAEMRDARSDAYQRTSRR